MEFCNICDNMLYVQHNGDRIIHKCNCCGKEVDDFGSSSKCISKTKFYQKGVSYQQHISEYVFEDPTLPRTDIIQCTNKECSKPKDAANNVIYIKYDHNNLLYLYFCSYCKHHWTTNQA